MLRVPDDSLVEGEQYEEEVDDDDGSTKVVTFINMLFTCPNCKAENIADELELEE
jgi:hypothetical protein